MSNLTKSLLWLASAVVIALAVYLWALREDPALAAKMAEAPAGVRNAVAPVDEETAPPVSTLPPDEPAAEALPDPALPALEDSDVAALSALRALAGQSFITTMIEPRSLVRRLVVTIDNLPNERLSMKYRVVRAVPGSFEVAGGEAALQLAPGNAARYQPLLNALLAADATHWVALYRQWYPLLQQAYAEMADPRHLFNDRLLVVIDHLLAVQVPAALPALTHPGVLYAYADVALQQQSAGARILIRMGPANAARVQERLREIRKLLGAAP